MNIPSHVTLVLDYVDETYRWHSEPSGFFGPVFETEHEARIWYEKELDSF